MSYPNALFNLLKIATAIWYTQLDPMVAKNFCAILLQLQFEGGYYFARVPRLFKQ